jgi:hypothetical protein
LLEWCCDGRGKTTGSRSRSDELPRRRLDRLITRHVDHRLALLRCDVRLRLSEQSLQELIFLVGVVASALVGAVVASRRPCNPIGWFFVLSASSFAITDATLRYAVYGLVIAPGSLPLAHAMAWPSSWLWVPGVALVLVFVPLYFPNGRLLSSRWRPILWLAIFASVTLAVFWAFAPGETSGARGVIPNPDVYFLS